MKLKELQIKHLACPEGKKQIKVSDANGLFLLVKINGSKLWRLRYRYSGKYQELALGQYPTIPLLTARKLRDEALIKIAQGLSPAEEKRELKRKASASDRLFGVLALAWWESQKDSWSSDHAKKVKRWIEIDMKPLSKLAIDKIEAGDITNTMLSIQSAGNGRRASTILSLINRVFSQALSKSYTKINPTQGLKLSDILDATPKTEHRAAITRPNRLGELIRDIDGTEKGTYCTVEALRLIPRLFLRPKEIRLLRWEYVDFDDGLIRIPTADMKKDREHLVPLARQVIDRLQYIKQVTGYSIYIFPSQSNSDKPISKNVMTNLLRNIGYSAEEMTAHGFRTSASTLLHEQGWTHDAIEAQLAHLTGSATSRAYNRSIYLTERKKIMQSWADYLDNLKAEAINGNVIAGNFKQGN